MDPDLEDSENTATKISLFTAKKKELCLLKVLLSVKRDVKRLKGDVFSFQPAMIECAEDAVSTCEELLKKFLTDPKSGGNYMKKFNKTIVTAVALIEDLKKETNFFQCKTLYADEILGDLEEATNKFRKIAR